MPRIGDLGERLDLTLRQGATFGPHRVTLANPDASPVDLTGATVRGKLRRTYDAATAAAELVVTLIDAAGGVFEFGLSDATTSALAAGKSPQDPAGAYVWDLEIEYADGTVRPLFWGSAQVQAEATR